MSRQKQTLLSLLLLLLAMLLTLLKKRGKTKVYRVYSLPLGSDESCEAQSKWPV